MFLGVRGAERLRDVIEWSMVLPSGERGLRITGHPVRVEMDRSIAVRVCSPSSDRVLAHGEMHLGSIYWIERSEELSATARDMVDARVREALRALNYLGAGSWATPAKRWEIIHA